jgi:cytochrome b561
MTARPTITRAATRYTAMAIVLHWVIAVLILINLVLVWFADQWPKDWVRPAIDTHKSIGITVLGLAIMRLLWRAINPPPPFPDGYPRWERFAAHAAHIALYALIFAIPLSGWLHDSAWKGGPTHPDKLFWLIPWPRIPQIAHMAAVPKEHFHDALFAVHKALAYVLYALFGLHVAAALKHQWIDRQPELQRMLPGRRR